MLYLPVVMNLIPVNNINSRGHLPDHPGYSSKQILISRYVRINNSSPTFSFTCKQRDGDVIAPLGRLRTYLKQPQPTFPSSKELVFVGEREREREDSSKGRERKEGLDLPHTFEFCTLVSCDGGVEIISTIVAADNKYE